MSDRLRRKFEGRTRAGAYNNAAGGFSQFVSCYRSDWTTDGRIHDQDWRSVAWFSDPAITDEYLEDLFTEFAAAEQCISARALALPRLGDNKDINVREALEMCDYNYEEDLEKWMMTWYGVNFEFADLPEKTSLYGSYPLDLYFFYPGPNGDRQDAYLANWGPFGQGESSQALLAQRELERWFDVDPDATIPGLDLNTRVTGIWWKQKPMKVETDTSKCYKARHVILTQSVGVLSETWDGLFHPSDDGAIVEKFSGMDDIFYMVEYYEIRVQFDSRIWTNDKEFIAVKDAPQGLCNWWQDMDVMDNYSGTNALVCTLTTNEINTLLPMDWSSEDEINQLITDSLGEAYPAILSALPCEKIPPSTLGPASALDFSSSSCVYSVFEATEPLWSLWEGHYSNWRYQEGVLLSNLDKSQAAYMEDIVVAHPAKGKKKGQTNKYSILTAGSATCDKHWGLVQGGYYSGVRAGKRALRLLGAKFQDLPSTEVDCDVWYRANQGPKTREVVIGRPTSTRTKSTSTQKKRVGTKKRSGTKKRGAGKK